MTNNPPDKRSRRWTFGEVLAVVLVVLLAVAAAAAALYGVYCRSEARLVLSDARMMRVAVISVSKAYYALDQPFCDPSTESGLTADAEAEVRSLSGSSESFSVLRFASDGYGVIEMSFEKNGYTAVYTASSDENESSVWTVYTTSRLI